MKLETRVFDAPSGKIEISGVDLEHIFKGYRPRLISYDDYKFIRRELKKELKLYLRGELVHLSKYADHVWEEMTKGMQNKPKQKGKTYVRPN